MSRASRGRALAQVLFLVLVAVFAWWGLRDSTGEVAEVLSHTHPARVLVSLVLVVAGLLATGRLWQHVLRRCGHEIPMRPGLAVFFVGQLGKYIPGSVWSMGVQAALASPYRVPARATVTTSLLFLVFHVATGLAVGGALVLPATDGGLLTWGAVLSALVGVLLLLPVVVRPLASRLGGSHVVIEWTGRDAAVTSALMAGTWACYGLSLLALVPHPDPGLLVTLLAGFALAYVAGVAVPVAPAGLGAREGVFLAVVAPQVGVATAVAIAVLARVVHTVADFGTALVTWWRARHAGVG